MINETKKSLENDPVSDKVTISLGWRRFWWIFLALILAVPYFLTIVYVSDKGDHLSLNAWFELLLSLVLLVTVLIVAYKLWQSAEGDAEASQGERLSQVFIFAIMVASFYAFGWPDDFLRLSDRFSELSVIMVLFLLAELAAHQVRASRLVATKITVAGENTSASIKTSAQDTTRSLDRSKESLESIKNAILPASKAILDANLTGVTKQLLGLNLVAESSDVIENPQVRGDLVSALAEYAACWAGHYKAFEEHPARLKCWKTICESYLREELYDLGWDHNTRTIRNGRVMFASNERLYFELLHALATSVTEENGYQPVYRAITNMLPQAWYNRRSTSMGTIEAIPHIDKFRKTVEEFVKKDFQYDRAILVSESRKNAAGGGSIVSGEILKEQERLCLLQLSTVRNTEPSMGPHPILNWRALFEQIGLNEDQSQQFLGQTNNDDKSNKLYGIVPRSIVETIIGNPKENVSIQVGDRLTKWNVKWEPLVSHYIDSMHSGRDSAQTIEVSYIRDPYSDLPRPNPDWLMVGHRKKGSKPEWLMALTSTLTPGSQTMLVDIVVNIQELDMLDTFWESHTRTQLQKYLDSLKNA